MRNDNERKIVSDKRQIHNQKKESTEALPIDFQKNLVSELETESTQKSISQNVLSKTDT